MKKLIALIPVLFILFACNSVQKMQNEWITTFLPEQLWEDMTLEAVNDEYERISDVFFDMGNDAITAFNDKGEEEDLSTMRSAYFLGLGELYELGGGNSDKVKQRNAVIERYKTHFSRVTEMFRDAMGNCLSLRDSSLSNVHVPSDKELFNILYGTPERMSTIDERSIYQYARLITIHEISQLERPVVASCDYDKSRDLWVVRLDNIDNQYVKFYERNDGDYDMEYSSKLNTDGTPKTDTKVTITFKDDKDRKQSSPKSGSSSSNQTSGNGASKQGNQDQMEEEIDDNDIPESMWTRGFYSGTLSGGGKSYNISVAISFPGKGKPGCPIIGSYQYEGHSDLIVLSGDWIELKDLYQMFPLLYSDEYFERFDLEMDGEDLVSSTVLKGTWSKYANEREYQMAGTPKKQLNVELRVKQ